MAEIDQRNAWATFLAQLSMENHPPQERWQKMFIQAIKLYDEKQYVEALGSFEAISNDNPISPCQSTRQIRAFSAGSYRTQGDQHGNSLANNSWTHSIRAAAG